MKGGQIKMEERTGVITMKGNPLTLLGNILSVGDRAPDFEVLGNDMLKVKLSDFQGKKLIICSVPSLDTPVCDLETRRFNDEAVKFGADVTVLTVSMDLPFAQKRWCGNAGIENVITLSDHFRGSFGVAYGVLIKELRLLARAVFVVNKDGIIKHIQIVKEVADEPDYAEILKVVKSI